MNVHSARTTTTRPAESDCSSSASKTATVERSSSPVTWMMLAPSSVSVDSVRFWSGIVGSVDGAAGQDAAPPMIVPLRVLPELDTVS